MYLSIDVASFQNVGQDFQMGRRTGHFLTLTPAITADGQPLGILRISDRPRQNLTTISSILWAINYQKGPYSLLQKGENDEYTDKIYSSAEELANDKAKIVRALTELNVKIHSAQKSCCQLSLIVQTFFNRLPVKVDAINFHKAYVKEAERKSHVTQEAPESCSPVPLHSDPRISESFPLFVSVLQPILNSGAFPAKSIGCCSIPGRCLNALGTIAMTIFLIVSPIFALYKIAKNPHVYNSKCHKINDSISTLLLTPIICALAIIKRSSAAIIHPGIMLRSSY